MADQNDVDVTIQEQKTLIAGLAPESVKDGFNFAIDKRFEYCSELGQGGGGRVCLAYDHKLQREVALKFITSAEVDCTTAVLQEARAQARVKHQNISE